MPRNKNKNVDTTVEHEQPLSPLTSKDEVYASKGFIVEDNGTSMDEFHEKNKKLARAIPEAAEETGIEIVSYSDEHLENGNVLELPNRISFQEKNINLSRLPVWFLTALGSMSLNELEKFRNKYKDELSVAELASLQILDGIVAGNPTAAKIYWTIQMKMLNKTNIANQINVNIQENTQSTSVSRMLDEITNKIAAAGNIVNTPTP